jgi:2-keto-4-pentenoate hydratase/2-oxohepta-3-ene-1,7-dioic acid hydratase in catechol pathway
MSYLQGELTIVTSKAAKDISPSEASDYILGYTIGNDLTSRMFQDPRRCSGQFTYAKAFDKFAPLGPRLVSPKVFEEHAKTIETRVNGKTMQKSALDLIFPAKELVSFLSQGE